MALSGRISQLYAGGKVNMCIDWTAVQNEDSNTSTVTAVAKVIMPEKATIYTRYNNTFRIDGEEIKFAFVNNDMYDKEYILYTATRTVEHDALGRRSVDLFCEYRAQTTLFGYDLTNISVSGTAELDAIAPPSSIGTVTGTVEINGSNECAVTIVRQNNSLFHRVRFYLTEEYQHTTDVVETSARYAIPVEWLKGMPNSATAKATVTLYTYRDSAGTQAVPGAPDEKEFILSVPASVKPSVQQGWATVQPYQNGSNIPESWNEYVQGNSMAQAVFDFSKIQPGYGATVEGCKISYAGKSYPEPYRTPVLNTAGEAVISCTVTDSRGRTASESVSIAVREYKPPAILNAQVYRSDQNGAENEAGTYLTVQAGLSFSSVNGKNAATLRVRYRLANGSYGSWEVLTPEKQSIFSGFSSTAAYEVQLQATDTPGNTDTRDVRIATESVALHLREGGKGGGIGRYGERDGWLEVAWDIDAKGEQIVEKNQTVQGDHTVQGLTNAKGGLNVTPPTLNAADDILALDPGWYYVSGDLTKAANYPVEKTNNRATIEVFGRGTWTSVADDGYKHSYKVVRLTYANGDIFQNARYWGSWQGWKQIKFAEQTLTEWIELTPASGITTPCTDNRCNGKLRCRKDGNHVFIAGGVYGEWPGSGVKVLCTLPNGYRPKLGTVCKVTRAGVYNSPNTARTAWLGIYTDGTVDTNAVHNVSGAAYSSPVWIDMNLDFWIE